MSLPDATSGPTNTIVSSGRRVCTKGARGGRHWWAHLESTRINVEPTIVEEKLEDLMNVQGLGEKNFLKLKPQLTLGGAKATAQPER